MSHDQSFEEQDRAFRKGAGLPHRGLQKYRKKPVVIEAVQFDGTKESANRILAWLGSNGADAKRAHSTRPDLGLSISTLEGDMHVSPGDFVIRGVKGEFYPCKLDIFEATYEPA